MTSEIRLYPERDNTDQSTDENCLKRATPSCNLLIRSIQVSGSPIVASKRILKEFEDLQNNPPTSCSAVSMEKESDWAGLHCDFLIPIFKLLPLVDRLRVKAVNSLWPSRRDLTFGVAVPSGLFLPIILMGSAYGRILGISKGSYTNIDQSLYAVLRAASLMVGSMRMTVSLYVIFLELTNNLLLLPITMIVLLIAKTVGDSQDETDSGAVELHGLILRAHLVKILKMKWFLQEKRRTEEWEVR